jgi:general stress protein YciG
LYFKVNNQILLTIKQKEVNMANKNNTQKSGSNKNTHDRGFASMPHKKVQEIASKGGHASTENTHNRGFASMPHEKVQEIASKGGKASGYSKHRNEEDEE